MRSKAQTEEFLSPKLKPRESCPSIALVTRLTNCCGKAPLKPKRSRFEPRAPLCHTRAMTGILAIGAGGALGAIGRYWLSVQISHALGTQFPWGILVVNIVGGFLMGLIAGLGAQSLQISHELKSFLVTGVLGGFTTFSAFSLDAALLIERGEMVAAFSYVTASVIGSIAALFAGLMLVRMVTQ